MHRSSLLIPLLALLLPAFATPAVESAFVHPGLLQTQEDIQRMKTHVAAGDEPWKSGFERLRADRFSSADWRLRGPFEVVTRGGGRDLHIGQLEQDANAAYQNALMYVITGDEAHAKKAVEILNAWSATLRTMNGRDVQLGAGLNGFKLVNAAELMRSGYKAWAPADIQRCRRMFLDVVYPPIRDFATFANGNWDGACIKTMIGIGVFCDDRAIFNRAVDYFRNGAGDGRLTHYVINAQGQCQESGRDQSHTQLGLANLAEACQIAWNQSVDLYGTADNRLLRGFEYTARYNLGHDVPFVPHTDVTGDYSAKVISPRLRGRFRPIFEMVLNHYQNLRGIPMPWTSQVVQKIRPEGPAFKSDHPGFGTLLFYREPSAAAAALPPGLPDALAMDDGTPVTTSRQWHDQRRPELLKRFAREMYGQSPPRPKAMTFEVFDDDPKALGGIATRRQVAIFLTGRHDGPRVDLLVYLPNNAARPVPAILGINFWGNHAVNADPGIRLTTSWMESGRNPWCDLSGVKDHRATEACRGVNARQWPVHDILARGYALATFYRGDIDPDLPQGYDASIRSLYPDLHNRGDNFSTIAAWAWGLSRAMDYLQTDSDIDARRVAVFGWSRLGKAALWAGATDERFAAVISNESGAGGAKLFRRGVGEDITRLNTVFPHWYCSNFRAYNGKDTSLPFDQHMVIALIAPRPVYIASAADDKGADPLGEFLSARAADPVYRLLGTEGLPAGNWPPVNHSVQGRIAYHVRTGRHDVMPYDWQQYLDFLDRFEKAPSPLPAVQRNR